uniref:Uncharacterized protein n=1 Tax=Anguilla anguilla TaxID=7936 RepID=A0A0E9R231_ANGAN
MAKNSFLLRSRQEYVDSHRMLLAIDVQIQSLPPPRTFSPR